jgi:hypothetical protein
MQLSDFRLRKVASAAAALTPEIASEFVYHAAPAIDAGGTEGSQMVGTFTRRTALGGFS